MYTKIDILRNIEIRNLKRDIEIVNQSCLKKSESIYLLPIKKHNYFIESFNR